MYDQYHCKMNMLSNVLAFNDGDDITYSSLTMRALQWNYDPLQSDLMSVVLSSYIFCFPNCFIDNIRRWHI